MSDPNKIKTNRLIAALIDGFLIGIIFGILLGTVGSIKWIGSLIVFGVYGVLLALKDAIPVPALDGASPGKKIMKIKAVNMNGANLSFEESIKRNLPFAGPILIIAILSPIPLLGPLAAILLGMIGFGVFIMETYFLWTKPDSRRWGDTFGSTQVVSTEGVAAASGFPPPPPSAVPPPPPAPSAAAPPPPPPAPAAGGQEWDEDTRH